MNLYLVHHGDAISAEVDPQRPLSERGRMQAERAATEAASRGAKPAVIWHSGKLRARQTAEPFWRLCNPLADFSAQRGLQPSDPPEWIRDLVVDETRDLILVGHFPHLPKLLALLTEGQQQFPQHGMVALESAGSRWKETWRIE